MWAKTDTYPEQSKAFVEAGCSALLSSNHALCRPSILSAPFLKLSKSPMPNVTKGRCGSYRQQSALVSGSAALVNILTWTLLAGCLSSIAQTVFRFCAWGRYFQYDISNKSIVPLPNGRKVDRMQQRRNTRGQPEEKRVQDRTIDWGSLTSSYWAYCHQFSSFEISRLSSRSAPVLEFVSEPRKMLPRRNH
ncbi:hypothetical protein CLAIMM_04348 [Cladophialophora immunda]|nr:hypothetical protein CLAIMM_04348 [Cladophialophora immunda]